MAENNNRHADHISPAMGEDGGAARVRQRSARGVTPGRRNARRSFNLFDLIVILLIAVVVALLIIGVRVADVFGGDEGRQVRLSYTVTLYNVDAEFTDAIVSGDAMYDVDSKAKLGTVKQTPRVTPHTVAVLEGESATMKSIPDRVDITVTLETIAVYREGEGYTVGGRPIRVGEAYTVRFPGYVGNVSCAAINGAVNLER